MRERNRRQICQLLFVAGCIVPTVSTFSWAAYRLSPLHAARVAAQWESRLTAYTGLDAQIQSIQYPGEGSTLLTDVILTDPDGGARVARLRQAEFKQTAQGVVVVLSQPEVGHGQFLRLWSVLHDRILRGPATRIPVQITAGELTLEVGRRPQSFTSLCCTIEPRDEGVSVLVEFQVAGLEHQDVLQVVRNRQTVPPATQWQLVTRNPIPCSLFGDYLPELERLGANCAFQGTVRATETGGTWSAEIRDGRFVQIDLDAVTEPLTHRIGGTATLAVETLRFHRGTLAEARGTLASGGGSVSSALLSSCARHLGAAVATRIPATQVTYSELACQFQLDQQGFLLIGCCRNRPNCLLAARTGPLLELDSRRSYSLVEFVRTLTPDSPWLVPATSETRGLLAWLPLPPRQASESLAHNGHIRLRSRGVQPNPESVSADDTRTRSGTPGRPGSSPPDPAVLPAGHFDPR